MISCSSTCVNVGIKLRVIHILRHTERGELDPPPPLPPRHTPSYLADPPPGQDTSYFRLLEYLVWLLHAYFAAFDMRKLVYIRLNCFFSTSGSISTILWWLLSKYSADKIIAFLKLSLHLYNFRVTVYKGVPPPLVEVNLPFYDDYCLNILQIKLSLS